MSKLAFSQGRAVTITFDDGTAAQLASNIDAYKAAINKAEEMEGQFRNGTLTTDLTDVTMAITGTSRYQVHVFVANVDISAGTYEFVFVETVPNVDEIS